MEILSWTIFRQCPARTATMLDTDTLPRVVELEPFMNKAPKWKSSGRTAKRSFCRSLWRGQVDNLIPAKRNLNSPRPTIVSETMAAKRNRNDLSRKFPHL